MIRQAPRSLSRQPAYRDGAVFAWIGVILLLVLVIGGCFAGFSAYRNSERTIDTVVIDKERVCDRDDCQYLVYTEDGTFKITDTWGILTPSARFNSSDVYGRIKEGPATLDVIGWRIGFFSEYPIIINVHQE